VLPSPFFTDRAKALDAVLRKLNRALLARKPMEFWTFALSRHGHGLLD
jgi:hypothetical protein